MTDGYKTEAEGYAASLRQQAKWVREALDPNTPASQRIGLEDIDVDELEAAADALTRLSEHSAAADVLERIAKENHSDPATDDLTVPLVVQLVDAESDVKRLHVEKMDMYERALAAEIKVAGAVKDFEAIKQATIDGRVCDDVAWFDTITTLHDFCAQAIDSLVSEVGKGASNG